MHFFALTVGTLALASSVVADHRNTTRRCNNRVQSSFSLLANNTIAASFCSSRYATATILATGAVKRANPAPLDERHPEPEPEPAPTRGSSGAALTAQALNRLTAGRRGPARTFCACHFPPTSTVTTVVTGFPITTSIDDGTTTISAINGTTIVGDDDTITSTTTTSADDTTTTSFVETTTTTTSLNATTITA